MLKMGSSIMKITGRTGLKIAKHSPEILLGAGIVSGIVATVMACKATATEKRERILFTHHKTILDIKTALEISAEEPTKENPEEEYTQKDAAQDKVNTYLNTTWALTKLYSPAIGMGLISIACILSGHRIMKGRNVALMAAYKIVDGAFKDYRSRVIDAFGKDADTQFMHDTETKSYTKNETLEDGTVKKQKVSYQVLKGEKVSMYARLFNSENNQWVKDQNYNWLFLKKKRDWLNDRLHAVGHVFLNEVYDELGFPHTQAGQVVGWISNGDGDGYISFGPDTENLTVMSESGDSDILLDFNVDGVIWDLI